LQTAIITGAEGFIGKYLTAELQAHNISTIPLRLPFDGYLPKVDVFYHLGWRGAMGVARQDAAVQLTNVQLTVDAIRTAKRLGCKKVVALGTVYENFPQANYYTLCKKYAREVAERVAKQESIPFTWATICHPIGCGIKHEQMMYGVISHLLRGESYPFGGGETWYDIIAVEDVARGLRLLGENDVTGEYYIGSGTPRRLRDYIEEVPHILGVPNTVAFGIRPDDGLRFEREWFMTEYRTQVSFEQAVRNTAEGIKAR